MYATTDSSSLSTHKRQHEGSLPFKCPEPDCDYASVQSSNLYSHIKTHGDERPYECLECEAVFKTSTILRSHELTHGEKKYQCDVEGCSSKFALLQGLRVHQKRHEGIREFVCEWPDCGKAFVTSSNLIEHERVHTNVRPYVCDFEDCEAAFKRKHHLDLHKLMHLEELPIKCDHENCDAAFRQGAHLKRHIFFYHTEKGVLERKKEEAAVAKVLQQAGIEFKREHSVLFSCINDADNRYARIDFVVIHNGVVWFIEIDEDQHAYYSVSCELARMAKVFEALQMEQNNLPVVFVRFNPNAFRVDDLLQRVSKQTRYAKLIEEINSTTSKDLPPFSIIYMYYTSRKTSVEVVPTIFDDPDYAEVMKRSCTKVIV